MRNSNMKNAIIKRAKSVILIMVVMLLGGCADIRRKFHYFPDMWFSPGVDAQQNDEISGRVGNLLPPSGSIAYGKYPYKYTVLDADKASRELKPISENNLTKGKEQYNIYCAPCHGESGKGDGPIKKVGKYVTIKPLVSPDGSAVPAESYNTAKIYHMLTMGIGTMAGYGTQVTEKNRWFIAQYVKALQAKKK